MRLSPEPRYLPDPMELPIAELRLRRALEAGRIAVWEWDISTGHVAWSENALELLGLRSGHTSEFEARVHPQDQERHHVAFENTIGTGEPYDIEFRFVKPDGTVIWVHDKAEHQWHQGRQTIIGITA